MMFHDNVMITLTFLHAACPRHITDVVVQILFPFRHMANAVPVQDYTRQWAIHACKCWLQNNKNERKENPEADSPDIPSCVLPLVSPWIHPCLPSCEPDVRDAARPLPARPLPLECVQLQAAPRIFGLESTKKYIPERLVTWRTKHSRNDDIIMDLEYKMGQNGLD